MNYEVVHTTEYQYGSAISLCHNIAKLMPRSTTTQFCRKTNVHISPQPDIINEYLDFFGNKVLYFAIQHEHKDLTVTVSSLISKDNNEKSLPNTTATWEEAARLFTLHKPEYFDARQYLPVTAMTVHSTAIAEYASKSFTPGRQLYEAVFDLMQRIHHDFEFKTGFTTIATPLLTVMRERKGVCQDFAHLAIACIRSVGLPARYVSGYIETLPAPGKEKLVGVDASHAWFSVFIPSMGWVDFDPTNNQLPADQHITIGWGRDYADVSPLKGVILSSGHHKLHVSVDVKRVR